MSQQIVRVLIEGRVQGVAFRWATRQEAQALKLDGWVRNLTDGRVEAVFSGAGELVDQMLEEATVHFVKTTQALVDGGADFIFPADDVALQIAS